MDNSQCIEVVEELNRRFELLEHEARSGGRGKWFVFLKKQSIIRRLDNVAPMNWQTKIISSVRVDDRVEVVMEMTIGDITRSYDGVSEDNRSKSKDGKPDVLYPLNTAKAASTDAFKRVASMFGIGLYLQDCPKIQASNESGALAIFTKWYNGSDIDKQPTSQQGAEVKWPSKKQVEWVMGQLGNENEGLSQTEILQLAGVTALDDGDGWRKYEDAPAAVAAIRAAFDAQLDNDNVDEPDNETITSNGNVVFAWKRYFIGGNGKQTYLELATVKPGNVNPDDEIPFAMARAYGRSTDFKTMIGDKLYADNGLAKYDTALKSTPWTKLKVPLGLVYEETEFYNTVTGLVKDDKGVMDDDLQEHKSSHDGLDESDYYFAPGEYDGDSIPF